MSIRFLGRLGTGVGQYRDFDQEGGESFNKYQTNRDAANYKVHGFLESGADSFCLFFFH